MTHQDTGRAGAAHLLPGGVVSVLLEQHTRIRELFAEVTRARGQERQRAFDELRELLAVHEAGEEIVVRPVTKNVQAGAVADARNAEEKDAATTLAKLEKLDVESFVFGEMLAELERDVTNHAEREESEEFPYLLTEVDHDTQVAMGLQLLNAQHAAPTHPHPTAAGSTVAQVAIGPFAALLDRARDEFKKQRSAH